MEDVLLIDDDVELCAVLTDYLGRHGFRVSAVHRGDLGLAEARAKRWAMILLDAMLPGLDGFEVLRRIRMTSPVTVLLLTARGEDVDRIVGLELGADDYVPKPFNSRELLARMRAILRRAALPDQAGKSDVLSVGKLTIDMAARRADYDSKALNLTGVEFALLESLMRMPGKLVEREQLAEAVLGRKFSPFDRSLDMHVSRLRKKIVAQGAEHDLLKTVRGTGYQLTVVRTRRESNS